MKGTFGWAGSILRVNLTDGSIITEPTERYSAQAIGGRGIDQLILFNELEPSTDALSPESKIALGAGPLVGTSAPASSRLSVDSKNVQSGGVSYPNVGGHWAPELKFAGFDHVVIEGASREPVFLLIQDGAAKIMDASFLWGKSTWETEDLLRKQLKEHKLRVASIGPAGENLVWGACLIIDHSRAPARGGIGAVFGAKKLKAIAVRGTQPVKVYKPDEFFQEAKRCWQKVEQVARDSSSRTALLRDGGTLAFGVAGGGRNFQDIVCSEKMVQGLKESVFRKNFEVRRLACFNCPVYCSHFYSIREGPYSGTACEGLEANTLGALGIRLGIDYPAAVVKGHALCSQLGIDEDFASATLGWAFECYQRGSIAAKDTGGLELRWGDHKAALKLLEQIAYREGFGAVLARGVRRAAEAVGQGSEAWASSIKGADSFDTLFFDRAWALGIAVSTRGGGHLDGAQRTSKIASFTPQRLQALFGISDLGVPDSYENKAKVVFWYEKYKALVDMLGMCYLVSSWEDPDLLTPEDYASLFTLATGVEYSPDDLMLKGQRVHNIEKAFNSLHAGFEREDDLPPIRFIEPEPSELSASARIDRGKWNKMLDEYYELQGWDPSTGQQTEAGLRSLGLEFVAQKLKKYNKLKGDSPQ